MKPLVLTFASHFKVTYYEERMLEVEDELGRVKEDRRQASIQVKIYFITWVFRSRLARSLFSLQYVSYSVFLPSHGLSVIQDMRSKTVL